MVGNVEKAISDQTAADDTGKFMGMGVLYVSGIELWIDQREENFKEALEMKVNFYTDGRKKPYEERQIAGRQTLVGLGGFQIVRGGNHQVYPRLIWNMKGMKYTLTTRIETVNCKASKRSTVTIILPEHMCHFSFEELMMELTMIIMRSS